VKFSTSCLICILPAMALWSCAPKAVVVVEPQPAAAPQQETTTAQTTAAAPEPTTPSPPDDGIRLPDMLALPGENELRGSRPAAANSPGESPGAVIARPPASN
jgi:hypothetical protein